ncbi:MAG: DUF5660 domain-containing protein [Microgenomates group bacterium]|nr:DUF5660 domain-containing protein [Microgenomates group bacterium]
MLTKVGKTIPSKRANNTLEAINDFKNQGTIDGKSSVKNFFGNFFNQFNPDYGSYEQPFFPNQEKVAPKPQRKEFTVFRFQEHYEDVEVKRQIKELLKIIRQEVVAIKKTNDYLIQDVQEIEKITLESVGEKPGVYHVRFLEIILSILKALRMKIGESKSWLEALKTKRKKRGSLFLALSKKKGTQFSLSKELQSARSVQ